MPGLSDFAVYTVPAIIYLLGFTSGYLVSAWVGGLDKTDIQQRIALLVTLIWILSVTSSIVVPDYQTAVWIHAIMGGVAGYLFSGEAGLSIFPGGNTARPAPDSPDPNVPRRRTHAERRRDRDRDRDEARDTHTDADRETDDTRDTDP